MSRPAHRRSAARCRARGRATAGSGPHGSVQFWAPVPLQVQICNWVPSVVLEPGSSRHRPDSRLTSEPFAPWVHCWASVPLQPQIWTGLPADALELPSSTPRRPRRGIQCQPHDQIHHPDHQCSRRGKREPDPHPPTHTRHPSPAGHTPSAASFNPMAGRRGGRSGGSRGLGWWRAWCSLPLLGRSQASTHPLSAGTQARDHPATTRAHAARLTVTIPCRAEGTSRSHEFHVRQPRKPPGGRKRDGGRPRFGPCDTRALDVALERE